MYRSYGVVDICVYKGLRIAVVVDFIGKRVVVVGDEVYDGGHCGSYEPLLWSPVTMVLCGEDSSVHAPSVTSSHASPCFSRACTCNVMSTESLSGDHKWP